MSEQLLIPEQRDLIWFGGADAVRFLNDLISQEIERLEPGVVSRSMLLGPRGKLDHLLWVLRDEERVGLITDEGRGPDLIDTLGRYRIRVDVTISDRFSGWLAVGGAHPGRGWTVEDGEVRAWLPWGGPTLLFGTGRRPQLEEMTSEAWDRLRVEALEPKFGVDVDEATIPQETGLVPVAVDFGKGCYLGQELVARIDSRGHVNRHLRCLHMESTVPVGSEITLDGSVVGTLTTVADDKGLALVRREAGPGTRVSVGGVSAIVAG